MKLRGLIDYDVVNFKTPSMFLIFPYCSFKCDKESKQNVCQNSELAKEPLIDISPKDIVFRYLDNPLTHAVVCGGLEPFDSWEELCGLLTFFRCFTKDPIIIYTGYKEEEIQDQLKILSSFKNIILKFGRFIPNSPHIYDTLLGVELASNNQYAKKIGDA